MSEKAVGSGRFSAADVAAMVFAAISEKQFYIYSYPRALGPVRIRLEDVVGLRNPTAPSIDRPEPGAQLCAALREN